MTAKEGEEYDFLQFEDGIDACSFMQLQEKSKWDLGIWELLVVFISGDRTLKLSPKRFHSIKIRDLIMFSAFDILIAKRFSISQSNSWCRWLAFLWPPNDGEWGK